MGKVDLKKLAVQRELFISCLSLIIILMLVGSWTYQLCKWVYKTTCAVDIESGEPDIVTDTAELKDPKKTRLVGVTILAVTIALVLAIRAALPDGLMDLRAGLICWMVMLNITSWFVRSVLA